MRLSSKSPSAWRSNSSPPSSTMSNTGSACGIHFISRCFHSFQPSFGCFRYAESWGSWFRRQPLQLSMRPRVDPTWGAESESGGWGEPRTSESARGVQAQKLSETSSERTTRQREPRTCAPGENTWQPRSSSRPPSYTAFALQLASNAAALDAHSTNAMQGKFMRVTPVIHPSARAREVGTSETIH